MQRTIGKEEENPIYETPTRQLLIQTRLRFKKVTGKAKKHHKH